MAVILYVFFAVNISNLFITLNPFWTKTSGHTNKFVSLPSRWSGKG